MRKSAGIMGIGPITGAEVLRAVFGPAKPARQKLPVDGCFCRGVVGYARGEPADFCISDRSSSLAHGLRYRTHAPRSPPLRHNRGSEEGLCRCKRQHRRHLSPPGGLHLPPRSPRRRARASPRLRWPLSGLRTRLASTRWQTALISPPPWHRRPTHNRHRSSNRRGTTAGLHSLRTPMLRLVCPPPQHLSAPSLSPLCPQRHNPPPIRERRWAQR